MFCGIVLFVIVVLPFPLTLEFYFRVVGGCICGSCVSVVCGWCLFVGLLFACLQLFAGFGFILHFFICILVCMYSFFLYFVCFLFNKLVFSTHLFYSIVACTGMTRVASVHVIYYT